MVCVRSSCWLVGFAVGPFSAVRLVLMSFFQSLLLLWFVSSSIALSATPVVVVSCDQPVAVAAFIHSTAAGLSICQGTRHNLVQMLCVTPASHTDPSAAARRRAAANAPQQRGWTSLDVEAEEAEEQEQEAEQDARALQAQEGERGNDEDCGDNLSLIHI